MPPNLSVATLRGLVIFYLILINPELVDPQKLLKLGGIQGQQVNFSEYCNLESGRLQLEATVYVGD
jgi:hypothetical protein